MGDPMVVKVIRGGQIVEIKGTVGHGLPKLVPKIFTSANYFIKGGVGFVELTLNCIENLGKSGESFQAKYEDQYPKRPFEKIVIISEIFPEYGLVDTAGYLKRVEKIEDEEVVNIEGLYNSIQEAAKAGKKKVLLKVAEHIQLPIDLDKADELDAKIKEKYGILYMKTPGGFRN